MAKHTIGFVFQATGHIPVSRTTRSRRAIRLEFVQPPCGCGRILARLAPSGMARLVRLVGVTHPSFVILPPDALGNDRRDGAYPGSLLARDIATPALGLSDGDEVASAGLDSGTMPGKSTVPRVWNGGRKFMHP